MQRRVDHFKPAARRPIFRNWSRVSAASVACRSTNAGNLMRSWRPGKAPPSAAGAGIVMWRFWLSLRRGFGAIAPGTTSVLTGSMAAPAQKRT
jgi:hypothetical protein